MAKLAAEQEFEHQQKLKESQEQARKKEEQRRLVKLERKKLLMYYRNLMSKILKGLSLQKKLENTMKRKFNKPRIKMMKHSLNKDR